jgi:hypothetical protein
MQGKTIATIASTFALVTAGVGVAFIARSTVRQGTRNQAAAAPELRA